MDDIKKIDCIYGKAGLYDEFIGQIQMFKRERITENSFGQLCFNTYHLTVSSGTATG